MKRVLAVSFILWTTVQLQSQPRFPADVLDLYAELKGRTILTPSSIPLPASVLAQALADTNHATVLIEAELAKSGFELVLDGEKFVRVLPAGWRDSALAALLDRIHAPSTLSSSVANPPQTPANSPTKAEETGPVPIGAINMYGVDVNEALKIYAGIRNRIILRPFVLPGTIRLRSQTPLTLQEVGYALTVVLALNGVAALDDGDKFVQIVPIVTAAQVQSRAPQPEKDAPLIDPQTVPSFPTAAQAIVSSPASVAVTSNSTVNDLVAYYASLAEREALPEEHYGKQRILFKMTIPLTKAELLYAIETTLALNHFTITRVDDKFVRVERVADRR